MPVTGPIFPKSNPWQVLTMAMSHTGWQHTCMRTRLSHFNVVVIVLIISAKNLINCSRLLIHTILHYSVINVYTINQYFYSTFRTLLSSSFSIAFLLTSAHDCILKCTIKYIESDYN